MTTVRDKDPKVNELLIKWDKVMDNAKYLGYEHRYKEKEYGIKWRSAYKRVMNAECDKLMKKFGNPLSGYEGV